MLTPSLLADWGRETLPEWDALVRSVNDAFRVIWNPLIRRWAVVRPGPLDQQIEFAGYNYPGWIYAWTVEGDKGQYREPDCSLVIELAKVAETCWRLPEKWQRLRWFRNLMKESQATRDGEDRKAMREATDAARREILVPARKGLVRVGPGSTCDTSRKAFGWTR